MFIQAGRGEGRGPSFVSAQGPRLTCALVAVEGAGGQRRRLPNGAGRAARGRGGAPEGVRPSGAREARRPGGALRAGGCAGRRWRGARGGAQLALRGRGTASGRPRGRRTRVAGRHAPAIKCPAAVKVWPPGKPHGLKTLNPPSSTRLDSNQAQKKPGTGAEQMPRMTHPSWGEAGPALRCAKRFRRTCAVCGAGRADFLGGGGSGGAGRARGLLH